MKRLVGIASALVMLAAPMLSMAGSPSQDLKNFRDFYTDRFPDTPLQDFVNGVYSIDKPSREQWEAFEDFPNLGDAFTLDRFGHPRRRSGADGAAMPLKADFFDDAVFNQ